MHGMLGMVPNLDDVSLSKDMGKKLQRERELQRERGRERAKR